MYNAIYWAAASLKVSQKTLISMVQGYKVHGNVTTPKKRLARKKDFFEKMSKDQLALIRLIIHGEFKKCNEKRKNKDAQGGDTFPSIMSILQIINTEYTYQLPNMTRQKLWICMRRLGFAYKRHPDTKNVLLIGK